MEWGVRRVERSDDCKQSPREITVKLYSLVKIEARKIEKSRVASQTSRTSRETSGLNE